MKNYIKEQLDGVLNTDNLAERADANLAKEWWDDYMWDDYSDVVKEWVDTKYRLISLIKEGKSPEEVIEFLTNEAKTYVNNLVNEVRWL